MRAQRVAKRMLELLCRRDVGKDHDERGEGQ